MRQREKEKKGKGVEGDVQGKKEKRLDSPSVKCYYTQTFTLLMGIAFKMRVKLRVRKWSKTKYIQCFEGKIQERNLAHSNKKTPKCCWFLRWRIDTFQFFYIEYNTKVSIILIVLRDYFSSLTTMTMKRPSGKL